MVAAPALSRHWWHVLPVVAGTVAGIAWAIGFNRFDRAAHASADPPAHADAIVVLTGGADRVETAIHLLVAGVAPELLISGVGRGSELPELARHAGIDVTDVSRRITVGHAATTTVGNANETAEWVRARSIRSLIVVTAGYHMPRALAELSDRLPGVTLFPVPVRPPAMRVASDLGTLRLLASEYNKLLAVRFGVSHLAGRVVS